MLRAFEFWEVLLERFGVTVETAHSAQEAFLMARTFEYDIAMVDIRLPDANGFECFCELKKIDENLNIALMTGYGYDSQHCIVKSRQQGLKEVIFKPFRLDLLLDGLEKTIDPSEPIGLA